MKNSLEEYQSQDSVGLKVRWITPPYKGRKYKRLKMSEQKMKIFSK